MKEKLTQLACDLIRMPTLPPEGNELELVTYLAGLFAGSAFETKIQQFGPRRANLLARVQSQAHRPPLYLTGHVDVVPVGKAEWRHPPFAAVVEDHRIYGRGAADMKSGIAAMVLAALSAAQAAPGELDLTLLITGGEETGFLGAHKMVEEGTWLEPGLGLLVCEPTGNQPDLGHKGHLWLQGVSSGVTAHGSMPHLGVNALYKACEAVLKAREFTFRQTPVPLFGGPTLNLGRLQGGININSVPDKAEFHLDIRTIPGMNLDELMQEMQTWIGDLAELQAVSRSDAVATDPNHPWVRQVLEEVARQGNPLNPSAGVYVTDAAILQASLGYAPVVVLGPGDAEQAHKTDEYCPQQQLEDAYELFRRIILNSRVKTL